MSCIRGWAEPPVCKWGQDGLSRGAQQPTDRPSARPAPGPSVRQTFHATSGSAASAAGGSGGAEPALKAGSPRRAHPAAAQPPDDTAAARAPAAERSSPWSPGRRAARAGPAREGGPRPQPSADRSHTQPLAERNAGDDTATASLPATWEGVLGNSRSGSGGAAPCRQRRHPLAKRGGLHAAVCSLAGLQLCVVLCGAGARIWETGGLVLPGTAPACLPARHTLAWPPSRPALTPPARALQGGCSDGAGGTLAFQQCSLRASNCTLPTLARTGGGVQVTSGKGAKCRLARTPVLRAGGLSCTA